jgi:3-keto-disaccharide hydrolase
MRSCFAAALLTVACFAQEGPQPRVVDPGQPGQAPSDAIVLFDGKDLSEWVHSNGKPAQWPVENGVAICKSGTGDIYSKHKFSNAQIHVEFATPNMPQAKSQARANSGVYLQGRYEIQVLDSYQNPTYANGSCGALYGQYAPLVNVCRPPEQWQTYDIIFHAPKCGGDGKISEPGTVTVLHNGVLVQDHVTVKGITTLGDKTNECEPGPLRLQDHHHPDVKETFMRYRNIWYRPLD